MNYGIALCRVSTTQQKLEGNSLSAQETRINRVAREKFNCEIVRTWSLDISSRKGKNFKRKDLEEMLAYCKKNARISYLFVDEHDRYMRSVDEYYMWKGRFQYEAGVMLVIAAKPELALNPNSASMAIEFFGVWQGEVSNEERITKTTEKMQARIVAGYFPGNVHTCYQATAVPGLHAPLEPQWSLFQTAIRRILYDGYSLRQALVWLQENGFTLNGGGVFDMNKFKRRLLDPYYAGITKISTWDVTGIGLHQAMITQSEYEALKEIVTGVKKKFTRQVQNPNFQMSNIAECEECKAIQAKNSRFVGYRNHNGKHPEARKFYERYMCRSCRMGLPKADLHKQMTNKLKPLKTSNATKDELKETMRLVWERRNRDGTQFAERLQQKLTALTTEKDALVRTIASNPSIADDIAQSVVKIKEEIATTGQELQRAQKGDDDFNEFVAFSLDYVDDLNAQWWDLTPDRRERCKQLSFPGGIFVDRNKRVSTPIISPIYRYGGMKKEHLSALNSINGDPAESRTPVAGMKTQCPGPLDDGAE